MKAVLVSIDGTICDTRHRHHLYGSFDFYKKEEVLKDFATPDSVQCLNELWQKYKIIYIGARPNSFVKITEEWLSKSGFPQGEIYLAENQKERREMIKNIQNKYDFVAGIGDRWDDNELHLEIGCLSIIVKEFDGNWNTVRKYLLNQ